MMHRLSVDPDGLYINSEIGVKKFVSTEEFKISSQDCTNILNQALGSNLIIPQSKSFCNKIKVIYEELKDVKGGKNAGYIPQAPPHLPCPLFGAPPHLKSKVKLYN